MENKKSVFTVKMILKACALICMILVFCPSFLVSCSGRNMDVSAMTALRTIKIYGEAVSKPHPIMLLTLILPAAALALLSIRRYTDRKTAGLILGCASVDTLVWILFRAAVKNYAENNYCRFETTGWFVLNIITLLGMMLLTTLVVRRKLQLDSDLKEVLAGGGTQDTLNQMSQKMGQMAGSMMQMAGNAANNIGSNSGGDSGGKEVIGFCSKCGRPIRYGNRFCTKCGTPVPEGMQKEADEKQHVTE